MHNFNILVFNNKIFFDIIKDNRLFSKYNIHYYDDFNLLLKNTEKENQIIVISSDLLGKVKKYNLPLIITTKSSELEGQDLDSFSEKIKIPFSFLDLEKKIISIISKIKFKKNSLINLKGYTIDKNERKIKKGELKLQLSEKEIDFLILFSKSKHPIKRSLVLKKVWHYSQKTETHTVETHIHRLRKKFSDKFGDNNFIKNNKKGYFI